MSEFELPAFVEFAEVCRAAGSLKPRALKRRLYRSQRVCTVCGTKNCRRVACELKADAEGVAQFDRVKAARREGPDTHVDVAKLARVEPAIHRRLVEMRIRDTLLGESLSTAEAPSGRQHLEAPRSTSRHPETPGSIPKHLEALRGPSKH